MEREHKFKLSDAAALWTRLTGQPEQEVRCRLRVMRESGILPTMRSVVTDAILARMIIGLLAGEAHNDAVEHTRKILDCRPARGGFSKKGLEILDSLPQGYQTFARDLQAAIKLDWPAEKIGSLATISVTVNPPGGSIISCDKSSCMKIQYVPVPFPEPPEGKMPIQLTKSVHGDVVHALAKLSAGSF